MWNLLFSIVGLLVGTVLALGFGVMRGKQRRDQVETAQSAATRIIEEAKKDAAAIKKEAEIAAKDSVLKEKGDFEKEVRETRRELQNQEKRLIGKEESIDKRIESVDKRESELTRRDQSLKSAKKISKKRWRSTIVTSRGAAPARTSCGDDAGRSEEKSHRPDGR